MSATTGPVLAMGLITIANQTVFHGKPLDWRVPIATGLLAVAFSGFERVWMDGAKMLAYTGLVAVTLTRVQATVPSPAESAVSWWNSTGSGGASGPKGGDIQA
ncbi:hypothetical protein GA0115240_10589 [Streptomyces sp. DvalAA-14]|uniref:hypothetical protein n=1 Tax=unclassified Streptomyces TaxID=2593676 RepID=UPI00081B355F|nr:MULTISPECIES: hypothetical protein [unclassified Streptomyces]MYS19158.1 hypothetical protein [Streptomyces sp. SID4948]SCD38061.1 hypothetical protein GA0115240_10589 [Streptomyces sp. DvalAA-14]